MLDSTLVGSASLKFDTHNLNSISCDNQHAMVPDRCHAKNGLHCYLVLAFESILLKDSAAKADTGTTEGKGASLLVVVFSTRWS